MMHDPIGRTNRWLSRIALLHEWTVVAACVSVPLTYASFFSSYFIPKQVLLSVFCALCVFLWMVHCALKRAYILPHVSWLWPLGLYLFFATLSLAQAANVYAGIEELTRQVGLWGMSLSVVLFSRTRSPRLILGAIAGTALIASVLGILQYAGIHWIPAPHERYGNLGVSTFGNTNFSAHYLDIVIPLLLGAALAGRRIWERIFLWFAALSCGYYMLLTQSRGGWIAVSVGLCFLGLKLTRRTVRNVSLRMILSLCLLTGIAG